MGEEKSVNELKEALDLALTALDVAVKANADGKVDVADFALLLSLIPKIEPAFSGLGEVPAELADLSADEAVELSAFVMAKFSVESEKAKLVLEKGLKALAANYELIKAIKA